MNVRNVAKGIKTGVKMIVGVVAGLTITHKKTAE